MIEPAQASFGLGPIAFGHQGSVEILMMVLTVKFRGVTLGVKLIFVISVTFGIKGL